LNRDISAPLIFLAACLALLITCLLWSDHLDVSAHITLASTTPAASHSRPPETPDFAGGLEVRIGNVSHDIKTKASAAPYGTEDAARSEGR
jgi:hypothetical protein